LGSLVAMRNQPSKWLASAEVVATCLPQASVRLGEHVLGFGGSLQAFGSRDQVEHDVARFEQFDIQGCVCDREVSDQPLEMTECIATWSPREFGGRGGFVLHSPTRSSHKAWVSNSVRRAEMATVFARLIVDDVDVGIHPFLITLRDQESGHVMPGIRVRDLGSKTGMNGVDSGLIAFTGVRLPRRCLLNANVKITGQGEVEVVRESVMLETQSTYFAMRHMHLSNTLIGAAKLGLAIGEACSREDVEISNQPTALHARHVDLVPHMVRIVVCHFASQDLAQALDSPHGKFMGIPRSDITAASGALQGVSMSLAISALEASIRSCGSFANRTSNRLTSLLADVVAISSIWGESNNWNEALAKRSLRAGRKQTNLAARISTLSETSAADIDVRWAESCVETRRDVLRDDLAMQLREIDGRWNLVTSLANRLARAEMDLMLCESMRRRTSAAIALEDMRELFVFGLLVQDATWLVSRGLLRPNMVQTCEDRVSSLCDSMVPICSNIVGAFNIPAGFIPLDCHAVE
jgi:acyl-CoA oxidase